MSSSKTPANAAVAAPTSKLDRLIVLLQQADGVGMPAMMAATGWQAHSVRGALAGALRKKGHVVRSEKTDAGRLWRIMSVESQA